MADQPTREQVDEITEAIAQGKKIEAIKIYRKATGEGLREAKEFVETLTGYLQLQDPERFSKAKSRSGCSGVLLFGLIVTAAAFAYLA